MSSPRRLRPFPDRRAGRAGLLPLVLAAACRPPAAPPVSPSVSPPVSPSGAPSFATRREHMVAAKPTALLAADLDGDGREDLVATDAERGELLVWRGGSAAVSGPDRVVLVGGWPLAPLALPGAAGAPRLVAVASRERRDLALHDPLGQTPERALRRVDLPATPRAMAAGDLGQDGKFDIAIACEDGRLALVGQDGVPTVIPIQDGLPRCALVLRDGSRVVLGYQDRRSLLLVDPLLDAGGPGGPRIEIELGGIPRALLEADLDRDGDLELVAAGGDGSIWVLGFGEPGGSPAWARAGAPPPLAWTAGAIPIDLASADLDGDGWGELVWLAYHDLSWNAAGGFARGGPAWRRSGYAGQTPCALALLDQDGDGRLDLAVASRDSQALSLARGLGADGFAAPAKVSVGRFPTALLAGDLDRDGRPDLVVLESKDDTASVLSNRAGQLERGAVLPTGPDPRGGCLCDLDADGHLDLALVANDAEGSRVRIWFGDGTGALSSRPGRDGPRVGPGVRALLAADVDRDGRADLLAADAERGQVACWRGLPGDPGSFALSDSTALELGDGPCALAAIELDADPGLEIAVALGGPGPRTGVAFLDPDGGQLRENGRLDTAGAAIALVPADLDLDGLDDLAVLVLAGSGSSGGLVHAFLREGASGSHKFRLAGSWGTSAHPRSIAAGDLDLDGVPDLVVAAQNAHRVDFACSRRATDEAPWHFEVVDALGAGVGCMDAVVVDLDGDSLADVAVANGHSNDVTILLAIGR